MTEEELWLGALPNDYFLGNPLSRMLRGVRSHRKLRLFTCACCRDVEKMLTEPEVQAIALAEQYADGRADEIGRTECLCSLVNAMEGSTVELSRHGLPCGYAVPYVLRWLVPVLALMTDDEYLIGTQDGRPIVGLKEPQDGASERARLVADWTATILAYERQEASRGVLGRVHEVMFRYVSRALDGSWPTGTSIDGSYFKEPLRIQLNRIRDIFGNPFRPVARDPAWLTSDVLALAGGIYEEKAFDRMPILADALQDAGCDNDDVLNHCRDTQLAHVRGCWVVDLLLGKA